MKLFVFTLVLITFTTTCFAENNRSDKQYPSSERFEKTIAAFEAADAEAMPAQKGIVCVGSSSMRMWGGKIMDDLAPLPIILRGFGGSNMNDVLHYVDRVVINYQPRAILLYEGDNDVAQGISPENIRDTFLALVKRVHEQLPECRFYVMSVKPSEARWSMWQTMVATNALLAAECEKNEQLTYIDVASVLLGEDGLPVKELFKEDKLHLSREGYLKWKQVVRPVLMAGECKDCEEEEQ